VPQPCPTLKQRCTTHLATDGRGIVRPEASDEATHHPLIFVTNALPGETVDVTITRQHRSYWEGVVAARSTVAEARIPERCPVATRCGGCALQHLSDASQRGWKQIWLLETLQRIGRWSPLHLEAAKSLLVVHGGPVWEYRQRIRLHCTKASVGFHGAQSNAVVDLPEGDGFCPVTHPVIRTHWSEVRRALRRFEPFRDPFELEITVDAKDQKLHFSLFSASSKRGRPAIHQKLLATLTALSCASKAESITLHHPFSHEFSVARTGFIQPHVEALQRYSVAIVNAIHTFAEQRLTVCQEGSSRPPLQAWDLYAGSGPFSALPAHALQQTTPTVDLHAVEGHTEACNALRKNCAAHHITVHNRDVAVFLANEAPRLPTPTVVITDPPRDGMGLSTTARLADQLLATPGARLILMISCSPASFARDGAKLLERGFHLQSLELFDLFGQTPHYEVIGAFVGGTNA
jgi:23S rRNA (uracil1939-C5)-methyltransferase